MKLRAMVFMWWFLLLSFASGVVLANPLNFMVGDFTFVRPPTWEWVEPKEPDKVKAKLEIPSIDNEGVANVVFVETKETVGWATVDETIERWKSSFEEPAERLRFEKETLSFGKRKVTFVHLEGTYKAVSSTGKVKSKAEFIHYGAIIEDSKGNILTRMLGPKLAVRRAKQEYRQMIITTLKEKDFEENRQPK